eukprot:4527784-Amphidinium_carterae.1
MMFETHDLSHASPATVRNCERGRVGGSCRLCLVRSHAVVWSSWSKWTLVCLRYSWELWDPKLPACVHCTA